MSYRQYKEYTAVRMPYSAISFGGSTWSQFLIESNTLCSSFTTPDSFDAVNPPVTTAGIVFDKDFICRTPFDKRMRVEGPVWGDVCFMLETNNTNSSYYVSLSEMDITLTVLKADGTERTLIAEHEVYPVDGTVGNVTCLGTGSLVTRTEGLHFTTTVDGYIEPDELLVLNVKLYGLRSTSSANLKMYLLCSSSDADISISLPFVEV